MKEYLGDGVYADFDGFGIVLTTENGICATNTIVLEPEVLDALQGYVERLKTRVEQKAMRARNARNEPQV